MSLSERRHTHRYGLKVPLVFCLTPSPLTNGLRAKSINISWGGVYFATSQPVSIGQPVQVLLRMPSRIAGSLPNERVFTGRVSHVERKEVPNGSSTVGIEFFYWEIPPREVQ
jgi:PilZ domain